MVSNREPGVAALNGLRLPRSNPKAPGCCNQRTEKGNDMSSLILGAFTLGLA